MNDDLNLWIVPGLYMLSLLGIAYSILQALHSGAEAYSKEYTAAAAQQLEDVFLFIPPRRILEVAMACAAACFIVFKNVAFEVDMAFGTTSLRRNRRRNPTRICNGPGRTCAV